jgi:hypothetical protein
MIVGGIESMTVDGQAWGPLEAPPVEPPIDVPPIDDIQGAIDATPVGGTLQVPAGTYPGFRGKDGISVVAAGDVVIGGHVDLTGVHDFVLNGWYGDGMHIQFASGQAINCSDARNVQILGVTIMATVGPFGDNGAGVALSGSQGVLIANCAFHAINGNALGSYNMSHLHVEGCDFVDCHQVASFSCWAPSGESLWFVNNFISGEHRGGIETGGDAMNFTDFVIQGNQFVDLKGSAMVGPVSYVGRPTNQGVIKDNYFERGPDYYNDTPEKYSETIELYGSAIEVSGNTAVDFSLAVHTYGGTENSHDNRVWNTPEQAGWQALAARPARPPRPPRYAARRT